MRRDRVVQCKMGVPCNMVTGSERLYDVKDSRDRVGDMKYDIKKVKGPVTRTTCRW